MSATFTPNGVEGEDSRGSRARSDSTGDVMSLERGLGCLVEPRALHAIKLTAFPANGVPVGQHKSLHGGTAGGAPTKEVRSRSDEGAGSTTHFLIDCEQLSSSTEYMKCSSRSVIPYYINCVGEIAVHEITTKALAFPAE